jgi:protein involved in temperature-dependent protein secretion
VEGSGGLVRGVGQRMFLAGQEPASIMDISEITFDTPAGGA